MNFCGKSVAIDMYFVVCVCVRMWWGGGVVLDIAQLVSTS